jgi:Bacterial membrane protein YfhO
MVFVGKGGGGRPRSAPSPLEELLRNLPAYRAASVAYVLTPADQALPQSRAFTLALRSPSTRIYRLAGTTPYFTSSPSCTVRPTTRNSVQLSCPRAARLVRRETYLRGWTARVDGRPTPVQRFDRLFQAVTVTAGTHRITFAYSPPHTWWGVAALVAGCAWLLGAIGGRKIIPRR